MWVNYYFPLTFQAKSELVATYALCGFSNIASLGIMIGGMSAMAPSRRRDIVEVGVRSLVAGSMACFMVASVAGMHFKLMDKNTPVSVPAIRLLL